MSVMYNLEASKQGIVAPFLSILLNIFLYAIGKVATMIFRRAVSVAFAF